MTDSVKFILILIQIFRCPIFSGEAKIPGDAIIQWYSSLFNFSCPIFSGEAKIHGDAIYSLVMLALDFLMPNYTVKPV